jgi:Bacterial regulatory proteins, luxR family
MEVHPEIEKTNYMWTTSVRVKCSLKQQLFWHGLFRDWGVGMKDESVRLGPREQQIAELLLQGCDNDEISKELKMARRTVKAHFNRLFVRFGINSGIKRVKLATLLYRRQLWQEKQENTANAALTNVSNESSNSSHKALKTVRSLAPLEPRNMS